MIRILTLAILLMFSLMSVCQTKGGSNKPYQQQAQKQQPSYGLDYWYSSGNQYGGVPTYGVSSFTWGITRSQYTDSDGYYKYKVWFVSTSYTWDYYYQKAVWRYTHIWNVNIYVDGYLKKSVGENGFSFRELMHAWQLTFYSKSAAPSISLSANHKML